MNNFIQEGDSLPLAAPYQRNAGEGALIGSLFGVAKNTVANGVVGEFVTEGVMDLTALATDVGALGVKVYWDNTNKRCTVTAGANTLIGVLTRAKANGDATMRVYVDGCIR
jgi:predicted RecA/RadA family phage recombinase